MESLTRYLIIKLQKSNTVKPVLETTFIKQSTALRDHCPHTTALLNQPNTTCIFITSLAWCLNTDYTVLAYPIYFLLICPDLHIGRELYPLNINSWYTTVTLGLKLVTIP